MHFLVTGGAGFIGSHLTEALLKQGHQVTVFDDFNDYYDPVIKRGNLAHVISDIQLVEADIRDAVTVERTFARNQFGRRRPPRRSSRSTPLNRRPQALLHHQHRRNLQSSRCLPLSRRESLRISVVVIRLRSQQKGPLC